MIFESFLKWGEGSHQSSVISRGVCEKAKKKGSCLINLYKQLPLTYNHLSSTISED